MTRPWMKCISPSYNGYCSTQTKIRIQAGMQVRAGAVRRFGHGMLSSTVPVPLGPRSRQAFSGVFQSAPYLPLQLVMNIKSDGPSCVPHAYSFYSIASSDDPP